MTMTPQEVLLREEFTSIVSWEGANAHQIVVDGLKVWLHRPLLAVRWPLYAERPEEAMDILKSLTYKEVLAVIKFCYSDLPADQRVAEVVRGRCQLVMPKSLRESTYVNDMRRLMSDHASCDFRLCTHGGAAVPVHRAVLVARTRYFRALFSVRSAEALSGRWECGVAISVGLMRCLVEYLYTGQVFTFTLKDLTGLLWLARYVGVRSDRDVENIVLSAFARGVRDADCRVLLAEATKWRCQVLQEWLGKLL